MNTKWFRRALPYLAFGLLLWALLQLKTAHAANYLGTDWDQYLKGGLQSFGVSDKNGEDLALAFVERLVQIVQYLIGGVGLLVALVYGIQLVMSRGKEETITKTKTNLIWLVLGFLILIAARNIAELFQPGKAISGEMVNFEAANDQLRSIVSYLKYLFGFILIFSMLISGIQLMMAQGEEEKVTTQKRNLTYSLIGMLFVLLASNLVNAFYFMKSPTEAAPAAPGNLIAEIAGIVKLALIFLGPLAIIMTIIAGFFYLTAFDSEERTKKARDMIIGGVTGIVLIYGALAIVNTFLAAPQLN
ncbi:hypothetical protein HZA43_01150 [Candidatus Peregrinibacteria bacterium]|nr:hypothetical protein [Candidatus Peregrinibacteria bacterium]